VSFGATLQQRPLKQRQNAKVPRDRKERKDAVALRESSARADIAPVVNCNGELLLPLLLLLTRSPMPTKHE